MWAAGILKTSCCHPVDNSFHSGCPIQIIVICGTSTFKQYIGLMTHYTDFLFAENGLQMALMLLLQGVWTSPSGTLVHGPLSQSLTLVYTSGMSDCAFLWMDTTLLQLLA